MIATDPVGSPIVRKYRQTANLHGTIVSFKKSKESSETFHLT